MGDEAYLPWLAALADVIHGKLDNRWYQITSRRIICNDAHCMGASRFYARRGNGVSMRTDDEQELKQWVLDNLEENKDDTDA